jgi:KDO2-lipid IV(A) lauroyltransferase
MLQYWLARVVLASLQVGSDAFGLRVARLWMRLLDLAVPRLRRTAYRNLSFALPEADARAITDGVYQSLARTLLTFARFPSLQRDNIRQYIRYEGFEHFEQAKRQGKGVLFATAHLGNWELSAFAHALMSEPLNVVVRPLDNPRLDRLVEARRALCGNRILSKRDVGRRILAALRRNEAVGILIDQNAVPEEGLFVDFFGVPACAHSAIIRLAYRSGAPIIPGFALWEGERKGYVLRFLPPLALRGELQQDTARLHQLVEELVRQYPDQWLWLHRRWKTRPPGSPPLY